MGVDDDTTETDEPQKSVGRWRDPSFIASIQPAVGRAMRWFDAEVRDADRLPEEGPFLIVGNHSGGVFMPDYWAFFHEWVRRRGAAAPLFALGSDLLFAVPGTKALAKRVGCVPASHGAADALLAEGAAVLVYPGGDAEDYRPWTERHQIDLRGHEGFVRLALRHGVPVVPLVSHGSHDAIIVVARGDEAARSLGLHKFRINVMPVVLGPFGPTLLPAASPPLPAKVISQVCEPLDWSSFRPEDAEDPAIVHACYEEMLACMQSTLDALVAEVPHPIRTRVGTALGFDRLRRFGKGQSGRGGLKPGADD